ncbi:hypothetical protein I4U23_004801 [Adineta vaga]|nr:hypothetical protein I4U23_004801 [Adineta vaga]
MHLAIACTFLLATIAFVQSKPILNNGNRINTILRHVASKNNLANQLSGRSARSIRSLIHQQREFDDFADLIIQTPQLATVLAENSELALNIYAILSEPQLNSIEESILNLANSVLSGQLDVNTAVTQFLGELQQFIGSDSQLFDAITNAALQALNGRRARSIRSAIRKQRKFDDLVDLILETPQLGVVFAENADLLNDVLNALSDPELSTVAESALDLANSVLSGELDVNTAVTQFLGELQQFIGSNSQLFDAVTNAALQALNGRRARSIRSAIRKQSTHDTIETVITENPQLALVLAQNAELIEKLLESLSLSQFEVLDTLGVSLANSVISGELDVNTAVTQFLGELQQFIGSDSQLFDAVTNAALQALNGRRARSIRSAIRKQSTHDTIFTVITENPQLALVLAQNAELVEKVLESLTISQFDVLDTLGASLANSVISGELDVNTAVTQFLGELQQFIGSNSQLFDAITNAALHALNGRRARSIRSAIRKQRKFDDLVDLILETPQLGVVFAENADLLNDVLNALSDPELSTVAESALDLANSVLSGELDVNTAVTQFLGELQQFIGSNSQLFGAVTNAVQQVFGRVQ